MTDEERIDDAYERIDLDTDEILAFYDGERVERCLKSIWDSTVTMHRIATVALKENAKLRKLACGLNWCTENAKIPSAECEHCPLGDTEDGELSCEKLMRELGVSDCEHD